MDVTLEQTRIPGLLVVRSPVHRDARGWFAEAWQRQKMTALGLPDFGPVQHNVSHNAARGSTRGIHAEPWDKLVTVVHGSVFGAWVDLREGATFGSTFTLEVEPGTAVYVPRGVGNSYQALADDTVYSYLVNAHWRPDLTYPALALDDPTAAIDWPIPLSQSEISAKDRRNPTLEGVTPFARRRPLILGGSGQIGAALRSLLPHALAPGRDELDLTDPAAVEALDLTDHDLVINAAAMTGVDAAETDEGRRLAWRLNAHLPAQLARLATAAGATLVHYSSDYVFDGRAEEHDEEEAFAPLGAYGQSKAAGDLAVAAAPRHYLLRTSWVVGETYLIGADGEMDNVSVVREVLSLMGRSPEEFEHVPDRAGHDRRYAIDWSRLRDELGWQPQYRDFRSGLAATIRWYEQNEDWWRPMKDATEAKYARTGQ